MSPAAGRSFGGYRLLRPIASDAISTTYYATKDDGGSVADTARAQFIVRVLGRPTSDDAQTEELVRSFLAAAEKAGGVDHPSVVRPRDLGVLEGHPYVVTPFIRAVPLGDLLQQGGAINESAALAIFAQLAGGLDTAHRGGVVHGALSPRTIWVGPSSGRGVAYLGYLTGFASAELLRERIAHDTRGEALDDLLYVAPEQVRGDAATRASDQYALACALYHTLVGEPPFLASTRSKLYGAHLMTPPPRLRAVDAAVAPSTSAALRRAMDKDPERRYPSCGVLVNAALPHGSPAPHAEPASTTVTVPAGTAPVAASGAARHWARWSLLLLGLAAVVVALVLWLLREPAALEPSTAPSPSPGPAVAAAATAVASSASPSDPASDLGRWSTALADTAVTDLRVADGLVLATDEDGTAVALEPRSGARSWEADVGAGPVAVGAGVVVHGEGGLTALDAASGRPLWRRAGLPAAAVQIAGGGVVAVVAGAREGVVRGVGVEDGTERWHADAIAPGGAQSLIAAAGPGVAYLLQDGRLAAVDRASVADLGVGGSQHLLPRWTVDVVGAWPALAATPGGVVVATRGGRACVHGADDGIVDWCADVPGAGGEQPRLFATPTMVVAATSRAVVAFEPGLGEPRWSVSPGSPANLVAVSRSAVAVVDGDDGLLAVDAASGAQVLDQDGIAGVTALAVRGRWLVVGTADGRVVRIDLDDRG